MRRFWVCYTAPFIVCVTDRQPISKLTGFGKGHPPRSGRWRCSGSTRGHTDRVLAERQLRTQAGGLSGHLDRFWPDIQDSGWIGGKAEGWERMPYWLDGTVPLAYLLDDPELKGRVNGYINYILEHQQEDGWLGPEQSVTPQQRYKPRDPWPVFVMLKVLTQYQEATGRRTRSSPPCSVPP